MKRAITLVFVAFAVAITSVVSHDKTEEDGAPFAGEEIFVSPMTSACFSLLSR